MFEQLQSVFEAYRLEQAMQVRPPHSSDRFRALLVDHLKQQDFGWHRPVQPDVSNLVKLWRLSLGLTWNAARGDHAVRYM